MRLNPCRHFAKAVSVLNVKFRQLSNFCQCNFLTVTFICFEHKEQGECLCDNTAFF